MNGVYMLGRGGFDCPHGGELGLVVDDGNVRWIRWNLDSDTELSAWRIVDTGCYIADLHSISNSTNIKIHGDLSESLPAALRIATDAGLI